MKSFGSWTNSNHEDLPKICCAPFLSKQVPWIKICLGNRAQATTTWILWGIGSGTHICCEDPCSGTSTWHRGCCELEINYFRIRGGIHWMKLMGLRCTTFYSSHLFHESPRKLDETLAYQASKVIPALFGLHHVHQPLNPMGEGLPLKKLDFFPYIGRQWWKHIWLELAHARKAGEKTPVL